MAGELQEKSTVYSAISASVAQAAAVAIPVKDVKKITIVATTTGNWTAFGVDVSADGTNYVTFNKLISNATNTNAQGLTRVSSFACNNTTATATMDLKYDAIEYIKVTATRVAGNATVYLLIER
jgi:hypothetical protein